MTNEEIARLFNNTRAFVQDNPDLCLRSKDGRELGGTSEIIRSTPSKCEAWNNPKR